MREQGVKNSKVGVSQRSRFLGEIEEVADHDVDENAQVVGIEVLIGGASGEKEIQQFEDEELKRRLAWEAQSTQSPCRGVGLGGE